jgi:two-component sensor histidine kinase
VSTLGDLALVHADLSEPDLDHLHALVGDWHLLADLSFADLLLLVPRRVGGFVCVGQLRPSTGPTAYPDDAVGRLLPEGEEFPAERAAREGRIVRDGEPEWRAGVPVRREAIPVQRDGRLLAVVLRDTNLAAARVPSQLELAYLRIAGDLAQMVADGRFPFSGVVEAGDAPRVGDGLLRLDPGGVVSYASPNALSAYRRLGLVGNVTGESLRDVHASLELAGSAVWRVLTTGRPQAADLERGGAEVQARALPLLPGGTLTGALVLVRDVTEVRRRERALLSKDATIREIHHRVKNNLQTVAALLRLQARRVGAGEARLALEESVRRVTSIALVHETLSQTLDETVAFDAIADQLGVMTAELATTGRHAHVRRTGSFGVLPATVATPLALVLSELLQNAVEHAFAGEGGGLEMRIRRDAGGLELVVADDGAGLPADFALEHSPRLGLQIVRTLVVGEMRGTLALRPGPTGGTEAVVAIPAASL